MHKNRIENVIIETELGFAPLEALQHAIGNPGQMLKDTNFMAVELDPYPVRKLGVVVPDAYGDLLVIDGNPLEDLTKLRDYLKNLKPIKQDVNLLKNTLVPAGAPGYRTVISPVVTS